MHDARLLFICFCGLRWVLQARRRSRIVCDKRCAGRRCAAIRTSSLAHAGRYAGEGDMRFTIEFAATAARSSSMTAPRTRDFDDYHRDLFQRETAPRLAGNQPGIHGSGDSTLQASAPPERWRGAKGIIFRRCAPAADRGAIKLDKAGLCRPCRQYAATSRSSSTRGRKAAARRWIISI